ATETLGSIVGADYLPVVSAPEELECFVIDRFRQEVYGPVHEREIGPAAVAGTEAPADVVVVPGVGRPRPGRAAPAGVRFADGIIDRNNRGGQLHAVTRVPPL